jgi:hypothetical protein
MTAAIYARKRTDDLDRAAKGIGLEILFQPPEQLVEDFIGARHVRVRHLVEGRPGAELGHGRAQLHVGERPLAVQQRADRAELQVALPAR